MYSAATGSLYSDVHRGVSSLAFGLWGNDDGLQTGPLKEVQLEGRYAPSSGFILHDGLSCQVNVDRYSNRHFSHTSTTV